MSLTALIGAALQVLVFTAIPFVVYLVTRRRARGFLAYVGLYRPEPRTVWVATGLAAVMIALLFGALAVSSVREIVANPATVSGQLRLRGFSGSSILLLVIYAWVQTALSEEILFRGFLAKRLIGRLGFWRGNAFQAMLFGAIHLALFTSVVGGGLTPYRAAFLFLAPTLIGWLLGYIKERLGNGSIIPGWWAHGLTNFIAFGLIAFVWR